MKAFRIIGLVCIIAGIILCATALVLGGFDMRIFGTTKYSEGSESLSGAFTNISVDTAEFDVRFVPAEDGVCRVTYRQNVKTPLHIAIEDGTLSIHSKDLRKWYDHITLFNFSHSQLTIYLPAREYGAVQVATNTGDIRIPADFAFADLIVHATTGNITLEGVSVAKVLSATVSTGDIRLTDISAATLSAKASTGKLSLQHITVADQLDVRTTTGDVTLLNATAQTLSAETSTGSIVLQDAVLSGHMALQARTGDIQLTACDAASSKITTSTGDVRGTLCSPKIFIANTSTGRVNVPDTTTGGTCHITCSAGDIDISLT